MAVVDIGVDSISENCVNVHQPRAEEEAEYPRPWAQIHGISFNPYEIDNKYAVDLRQLRQQVEWIPDGRHCQHELGVTRGCARLSSTRVLRTARPIQQLYRATNEASSETHRTIVLHISAYES